MIDVCVGDYRIFLCTRIYLDGLMPEFRIVCDKVTRILSY